MLVSTQGLYNYKSSSKLHIHNSRYNEDMSDIKLYDDFSRSAYLTFFYLPTKATGTCNIILHNPTSFRLSVSILDSDVDRLCDRNSA